MKNIIVLFIMTTFFLNAFSQQYIQMKEEKVELNDQKFFVGSVVDQRMNKSEIGEISRGTLKKPDKILIDGGLLYASQDYFMGNFQKSSENQHKTEVHIKYLQVKQELTRTGEYGYVKILIDFIDEHGKRHETKAEITDEVPDAFSTHEERIRRGFYECVIQYNNSLEYKQDEIYDNEEASDETIEIVFDKEKETDDYTIHKKRNPANRNITTVGYQIGGMTLLGINHEIRVHDYFGVHFGGGIFGYTGGIKIHTNEKTNSLFINLSWKDGGFGLMNGIGLEAGSRWVWIKRSDFGLLYQGGIFILNHMDEDFKNEFYGASEVPTVFFLIGLGLSW